MPHFSDEEILVAVEEANRRKSYVMAHCHTDEGANRCVDLGVRSIEHGSLIKEKTAKKIMENKNSITGSYLSKKKNIIIHNKRRLAKNGRYL